MTIKDIARESGYAVGTVSRVLNHNPSVRPEAREKILAVVAQYGYQPNANAKHLKQQAYEGLALVVKGTKNALFADLLDKLQAYVEKCGYTPTVYYINETGDEMTYAQMLCTERKPYGIFFIGSHPHCFTPELAGLGIPCVLLTNNAASLGIPNLSSFSSEADRDEYIKTRLHDDIAEEYANAHDDVYPDDDYVDAEVERRFNEQFGIATPESAAE